MNKIGGIIIASFSGVAYLEGEYTLAIMILVLATLWTYGYFFKEEQH